MAGTVHTKTYRLMTEALLKLRNDAGLSQAKLATIIGKPPSFVGKYEQGERRLDIIELLVILKALGSEWTEFLEKLGKDIPERLD